MGMVRESGKMVKRTVESNYRLGFVSVELPVNFVIISLPHKGNLQAIPFNPIDYTVFSCVGSPVRIPDEGRGVVGFRIFHECQNLVENLTILFGG